MMRALARLTIFIVFLPMLFGCGRDKEQIAEQEILAHAPEFIGSAEGYRATIQGVTARHVNSLSLLGIGAKPDQSLIVDPLTLTLQNVCFTTRPFHITSIGKTTFSARVSESALNTVLRQQIRSGSGVISNARIELKRNQVHMTFIATAAGVIDVPVSTIGRMDIQDGLRLSYIPEKVVLGDMPIPRIIKGLMAARVNPIIDFSCLRFTPHITSVRVNSGEILLSGTAELRNMP